MPGACEPSHSVSSTSLMTVVAAARVQGEADYQVLEVFRNAYEEVRRGYNDQLINERKTNLAALLLDVANKEASPGLVLLLSPAPLRVACAHHLMPVVWCPAFIRPVRTAPCL